MKKCIFTLGLMDIDIYLKKIFRKDATLREIVDLIKSGLPLAMKKDVKFKFYIVFQDSNGNMKKKEVGLVYSVKKSRDEFLSLSDIRFAIGDYLDLNIISG